MGFDQGVLVLIGLRVKIDQNAVPFRELVPGFWAWTDQRLDLPKHWREWLGSLRAEQIENCNFALLSKIFSKTPDILDAENQLLQLRARGFYVGLLLCSPFTPSLAPIALTGARRNGEIDVRQQSTFDIPSLNVFRNYPEIRTHEVEQAAHLARHLETLKTTPPPGGPWRLWRALSVYVVARSAQRLLDRLHQYCRCIDGLILSEPGRGNRQFKSRTELFIGPHHHDLMGRLYAIRGDAEHLHEHKYLETFDRATRLDLVQKEAIAEYIARKALAHIIGTPTLWSYFSNTAALASFWKLSAAAQLNLWAALPINPNDALDGFDPKDLSDNDLGSP